MIDEKKKLLATGEITVKSHAVNVGFQQLL